jgi:hypothetical protein
VLADGDVWGKGIACLPSFAGEEEGVRCGSFSSCRPSPSCVQLLFALCENVVSSLSLLFFLFPEPKWREGLREFFYIKTRVHTISFFSAIEIMASYTTDYLFV